MTVGLELVALLDSLTSAGERALAVSLAAREAGDPALAGFLVRSRHLAVRGGSAALIRAAALEPPGSVAVSLAQAHRGALRVWPVGSTRPTSVLDPCVSVVECAGWWNLAGPAVADDGALWVRAGSIATPWADELASGFGGSLPAVLCTIDLEAGGPVVGRTGRAVP